MLEFCTCAQFVPSHEISTTTVAVPALEVACTASAGAARATSTSGVGPVVVKVLSLPFIWLLNGIGYIVSLIAIKRGYTKDVLNTRIMTIMLLIGVTVGYILGKLV